MIVNVDIIFEKVGMIVDFSKMYLIGDVFLLVCWLVKIIYEVMWKGIEVVKSGVMLGDIGYVIQCWVEEYGYSVVREYCGYGIGQEMYEELQVLYYGCFGEGVVLQEGMVFIIELMVNQGDSCIKIKKDGWMVVICDKKFFV